MDGRGGTRTWPPREGRIIMHFNTKLTSPTNTVAELVESVTVKCLSGDTDRERQAVEGRMQPGTCVRQNFQSVPPLTRLRNVIFINVTDSNLHNTACSPATADLVTNISPYLCEYPVSNNNHDMSSDYL